MKNTPHKEHYASPTIDLIEITLERGFAASTADFTDSGLLESDESDEHTL